ncbi:alpha/beta hydrolase-fold protein [Winogradskyella sp. SM1960]|uniref:alpha/beta hydrolase-fold protein n=1 Tax=Winogradskyella sp. SM1960 TaxID=2865955 RepID=UPI001CD29C9A|nr:alpha/beta hydrolase-fold protein [Winogradskyella sp. SM1960]
MFTIEFRSYGNKIFYYFILCLCVISCSSETTVSEQNPFPEEEDPPFSRLLTNQKFYSSLLGEEVEYAVLLPEGYETSTEEYPVTYLFHGFGDNEDAWYTNGMIQYYSDQYSAEITPMIFVMPNAYNTYYANRYNGMYPYMDMLSEEMVSEIDDLFRTKSSSDFRAAMGYSMGGYGALILPALNPDVFSVGVPLSMSFRTDAQYLAEPQSVYDYQWSPIFGGIGASGQSRITDYFRSYSPFHFFEDQEESNFHNLKLFIDCGDDEESLSVTNDKLHTVLRDLSIPHEYRVRSGGHSFNYWKQSYPEALKFISDAFLGVEYNPQPSQISIGESINHSDYQVEMVNGVSFNVLKNLNYDNLETTNFPVLYFIHDHNDQLSVDELSALSLLYNAMANQSIPEVIIVEIPFENDLNSDNIQEIITYMDANFRTLPIKEERLLIGNVLGGLKAAQIINDEPEFFNSCFLFEAQLTGNAISPVSGVFYYLDIADDSEEYNGYHDLYSAIREQNINYEYRVRQGQEIYQFFLSGLENSLSILNEKL